MAQNEYITFHYVQHIVYMFRIYSIRNIKDVHRTLSGVKISTGPAAHGYLDLLRAG